MTTKPHTQGRLKVQHPHAGMRGFELADADTGLNQVCQDVTESNARRLAACWNAFEGASTEAIEELGPIAAVIRQTRIFEIEAERDTLLQHLQACVTGWQKGDDVAGPMHAAMALLAQHQATATRIRTDISRGARQSDGKLP